MASAGRRRLWCGTHLSRAARRSGVVVGIDLSERLIAVAEEVEFSHRLGITYRAADITAPGTWWDGRLFDGVVCEMALMDIDDLVSAVATFRTVVRPAGALRVSIVNPCFPGNEAGLSSWPPDRATAKRATGRRLSTTRMGSGSGSDHRTALSPRISTPSWTPASGWNVPRAEDRPSDLARPGLQGGRQPAP